VLTTTRRNPRFEAVDQQDVFEEGCFVEVEREGIGRAAFDDETDPRGERADRSANSVDEAGPPTPARVPDGEDPLVPLDFVGTSGR
jgi:hypothetical protein